MRSWGITLLLALCGCALAAAPVEDIFFSVDSDSLTLPIIGNVDNEDAVFNDVTAAEPGGTAGTYALTPRLDMSVFGVTSNIDAIHYVHRSLTVPVNPGGTFTVPAGSLLVSFDVDGVNLPGVFGVAEEDISLFVPTTPGDFSAGIWYRFFDGSDVLGAATTADIDALCLVEQTITTGGQTLNAGDLLLSFDGVPGGPVNARAEDVVLFHPDTYNSNTAGTFPTGLPLFQGADVGVTTPGPPAEDIKSVSLTYVDTQVGDTVIPAGSLIMSVGADGSALGNPVEINPNNEDVFYFVPTSLGGGPGLETQGTFHMLLDGDPALSLGTAAVDAFSLIGFPALSASLTHQDLNGGALGLGDIIEYTLVITNNADASASGVSVSGTISPYTEALTVLPGPGTDNSSDPLLQIDDIEIAPLGSVSIIWRATTETTLSGGENVTMSGTVSPAIEGGTGDSFDDAPGLSVLVPNLSTSTLVGVDGNGGSLNAGDLVTYTLTLRETAGLAATVDVDDTLPAELGNLTGIPIVSNATGSVSWGGNAFSITGIAVPAGSSTVTVTFSTTVDAGLAHGTAIHDTATLTVAEGGAPVPLTDNSLPAVTVIPDLTSSTFVGADGNGGNLNPGDPVNWTLTLHETAGGPATVSIDDTLPAEVGNITGGPTVVPPSGTDLSSGNVVNVDNIAVPASGTVTVTYSSTVDSTGVPHLTLIQDDVTLTIAEGGGPITLSDTSLPPVTVIPVLTTSTLVGSDVNGGSLVPGDTITWTLTLRESAGSPATVSVDDTLPAAVGNLLGPPSVVPLSGTNLSSGNVVDINSITVPAGGTVTVTFASTVDMDVVNLTSIQDSATLTIAEGGGPVVRTDTSLPLVTVVPNLSTSTLQADDTNGDPLMADDPIIYTLTLTNSHNRAANGVNVLGTAPAAADDVPLLILDDGGFDSSFSTDTVLDVRGVTVGALGSTQISWLLTVDSGVGAGVPIEMNVTVGAAAEGGSPTPLSSNQLISIPAELTVFTAD